MATLYELNEKIRSFDLEVDEETGEILNAGELEEIELARNEKIENIALWIKNLKSDAEAYEKEERSFTQKKKTAKNKIESLKSYLECSLAGEKFKTDRVSISYRRSESVEVDPEFIDERFITYEPKISKTDIKEALKAGEELQGARLIEKQSMQIK